MESSKSLENPLRIFTNSWKYPESFSLLVMCTRFMGILNAVTWSVGSELHEKNGICNLFVWWVLMPVIFFKKGVFRVAVKACLISGTELVTFCIFSWYLLSKRIFLIESLSRGVVGPEELSSYCLKIDIIGGEWRDFGVYDRRRSLFFLLASTGWVRWSIMLFIISIMLVTSVMMRFGNRLDSYYKGTTKTKQIEEMKEVKMHLIYQNAITMTWD